MALKLVFDAETLNLLNITMCQKYRETVKWCEVQRSVIPGIGIEVLTLDPVCIGIGY